MPVHAFTVQRVPGRNDMVTLTYDAPLSNRDIGAIVDAMNDAVKHGHIGKPDLNEPQN